MYYNSKTEELKKPKVKVIVKEKEKEDNPWHVILYDDDEHTIDEVIEQIIKAIKCDYLKARDLTLKVHFEGKAIVFAGEFLECLQVEGVLKEIQLITEIRG